jgi:hypothetical protein
MCVAGLQAATLACTTAGRLFSRRLTQSKVDKSERLRDDLIVNGLFQSKMSVIYTLQKTNESR